jgi:hypothetical protein
MDSGSIAAVGVFVASLNSDPFVAPLGVDSILPVGMNGRRILRGSCDVDCRCSVRVGVEGNSICPRLLNVVSRARSISIADRESLKSRRDGGSGEGARGPRGRREEVEFDRPFLVEAESNVGVGVVGRE